MAAATLPRLLLALSRMRVIATLVVLAAVVTGALWVYRRGVIVDTFPPSTPPDALTETAQTAFRPGQVWSYQTRPGEDSSRVIVLRVEEAPELGVIVHVAVEGLNIRNPKAPGGRITRAQHLPFAKAAVERSVVSKLQDDSPIPPFEEGYRVWREAYDQQKGGVFTITIAEAVQLLEPRS